MKDTLFRVAFDFSPREINFFSTLTHSATKNGADQHADGRVTHGGRF